MNVARRLLRNKLVRQILVILIIGLTVGLFIYYIATHPETLKAISRLSPLTVLQLTLAYIGTILANAFVLFASLRLIKKPVGFLENIALTGYSSVVNFFGPLQSGPGFRAAYLKKQHGVGLKRFFYVTVLFYGFFALLNGLIIALALLGTLSGAYAVLALIAIIVAVIAVVFGVRRSSKLAGAVKSINLSNGNFWYIGVGALLLAACTATAYFIELTQVDPSVTISQTIIYTAAANLALFVSLTPGAIGFRESFLLLSQQLHGISTNTVIAASVIDRAFYVVFLLALFLVLLAVGGRARLKQTGAA